MSKWFGVSFPFYRGNSLLGATSRVLPKQEDSRLIRNDLTQGLLTLKGERLFRDNFGGDVGRFLFDLNDSQSRTQLEQSIRDQIRTYHDRIILTRISINEDAANPNVMVVELFGRTDLEATNVDSLLTKFFVPVSGSIGSNTSFGRNDVSLGGNNG